MNGRRARGRAVAVLAALVVGLAGMAAGDRAFAAAGGTVSAAADGYVVRVKVGGSRGCTGVLLDYQIVATSKECFQVGATPPVSGPPPADSTVVSRPDQGASTSPVAVDYLIVRDDRNVVLAHLATILVVSRAKVSAAAPTAGEALRVVGFGRTAGEWVPDLPHTAPFSVQDVSGTGFGLTPTGDGSICKGDAGGPVVRDNGDGTSSLVALVSTSWQGGCLTETSTRRDATATRVDDLSGWIDQFKVNTLTGTVEAGTDSGCLIMHVGTVTYNLAGGDSSVVRVGATVHLTGYPAPSPTSSCTQGMRFQITKAVPVLTLTGTVTSGVESGCLVLPVGASSYLLIGGDRTIIKAGAKVTVTGYVDSVFSTCMQGAGFTVLSAAPAMAPMSGTPATLYNPASHNIEVYFNSGGALAENYWNATSGWAGSRSIGGGAITGRPAAVYNPASGNVEVYFNSGGILTEIYWNATNGWSGAVNGGLAITGDPAAVYDPASGNLEVYFNSGGTLTENYWNATKGWSGAVTVGGSISGDPAPLYDPGNQHLEVYFNSGGTLKENWWSASSAWSGALTVGGSISGDPAPLYDAGNQHVEVYFNSGGTLTENWWSASSGWSGAATVGGSITGNPAPLYDPSTNNAEVYFNSGGTLTENYWSPSSGWSGAATVGGTIASGPAVVYDQGNKNVEVYFNSGGLLAENYWNTTGGWSGPRTIN